MQHDNNFVFRQNGIMWTTLVEAFRAWHCRSASIFQMRERTDATRLPDIKMPESKRRERMPRKCKKRWCFPTASSFCRCMPFITHMHAFNLPFLLPRRSTSLEPWNGCVFHHVLIRLFLAIYINILQLQMISLHSRLCCNIEMSKM